MLGAWSSSSSCPPLQRKLLVSAQWLPCAAGRPDCRNVPSSSTAGKFPRRRDCRKVPSSSILTESSLVQAAGKFLRRPGCRKAPSAAGKFPRRSVACKSFLVVQAAGTSFRRPGYRKSSSSSRVPETFLVVQAAGNLPHRRGCRKALVELRCWYWQHTLYVCCGRRGGGEGARGSLVWCEDGTGDFSGGPTILA